MVAGVIAGIEAEHDRKDHFQSTQERHETMKHRKDKQRAGLTKIIWLCAILAATVPAFSTDAWPWTVTVKNDSGYTGTFSVGGEHLFWVPTECKLEIESGESKDCTPPGAICPTSVQWTLRQGNKGISNGDTQRGAKCWNSTFRVYKENNEFKWEWR